MRLQTTPSHSFGGKEGPLEQLYPSCASLLLCSCHLSCVGTLDLIESAVLEKLINLIEICPFRFLDRIRQTFFHPAEHSSGSRNSSCKIWSNHVGWYTSFYSWVEHTLQGPPFPLSAVHRYGLQRGYFEFFEITLYSILGFIKFLIAKTDMVASSPWFQTPLPLSSLTTTVLFFWLVNALSQHRLFLLALKCVSLILSIGPYSTESTTQVQSAIMLLPRNHEGNVWGAWEWGKAILFSQQIMHFPKDLSNRYQGLPWRLAGCYMYWKLVSKDVLES